MTDERDSNDRHSNEGGAARWPRTARSAMRGSGATLGRGAGRKAQTSSVQ